jgi:hypothetical protein
MSGLIKFKFGFENLLKICFEKLEKKKERNFFLLSGRFPPAAQLPGLPQRPASFSRARHFPAWAKPSHRGPASARACFFLRVADMWDPPVSVSFHLPFFLLRPNAAFPLFPDPYRAPIFSFLCSLAPPGYKNETPCLPAPH